MKALNEAGQRYVDCFAALKDSLPGAGLDWLAVQREQALARFAATGFPSEREERWKYTSVHPIEKRAFQPAAEASVSAASFAELCMSELEAIRLVFVNGRFNAELSVTGDLPEGVVVASLAQALAEQPALLERYLNSAADPAFSGFSALNTALAQDGAVILLPANAVLAQPIYLLFISTASDTALMSHPRVLIAAEANSEVTVIEHYAGEAGAANLTNVVTEVIAADNARVTHYKLQEESQKGFHISSLHAKQSRDSRFVSHNINLGGKLVRNDLQSDLNAENAEVELNGLFFGNGRQHVDNHTLVNHLSPLTRSEENYKGILNGQARGVFNGRAVVHRDAQQIEAHQSNANLLLSDKAEIDTKPELEIYADDVKCSHGSTTGRLDENAVFALRSRGLSEGLARGLLTLAFANEVIDRIKLLPVHERIERAVAGRLPDTYNLKGFF